MKIIVETARLLLRELEPSDASALHPVFSDLRATRFTLRINSEVAETLAWIEAIRKNYIKRGFSVWAVVRKNDNILLGYCGCSIIQLHGKEQCEVGYRIIPSCWGQGFATEALFASIDYAFAKLSFTRLVALIQPGNIASIRVAEKAGMTYECETVYEGVPMKLYEINMDRFSISSL